MPSHQVGPALLVLGEELQRHGLGTSLLERLLELYHKADGGAMDYVAKLCTNHRCHRDILDLPSKLFYNSSLVPMSGVQLHPLTPYPLLFICSSLSDPKESPSDICRKEAAIILQQLKLFATSGDTRRFLEGSCVMALSRRQVS